jgi:hypothetical protein
MFILFSQYYFPKKSLCRSPGRRYSYIGNGYCFPALLTFDVPPGTCTVRARGDPAKIDTINLRLAHCPGGSFYYMHQQPFTQRSAEKREMTLTIGLNAIISRRRFCCIGATARSHFNSLYPALYCFPRCPASILFFLPIYLMHNLPFPPGLSVRVVVDRPPPPARHPFARPTGQLSAPPRHFAKKGLMSETGVWNRTFPRWSARELLAKPS